MCKACSGSNESSCADCPARYMVCNELNGMTGVTGPDIVNVVEKWSSAHPRKTRQDVFLEQWPEANVDKSTGVLIICPAALKKEYRDDRGACNAYTIESSVCNNCRREFWMQEVE